MLCPYCDGTPTLERCPDGEPYVHCANCEMDFGYGHYFTDESLVQEWNEWVKLEMEARYEQAGL